jgi:6-phosphogluconolactonase
MVWQLKKAIMKKVIVFEDFEQLSVAAAHAVFNTVLNANGVCNIALSGGNTPRRMCELLAAAPFRGNIDWKKVNFFFADERYVPPASADSNFKMINDALLSKINMPAKNIHRMGTGTTPAKDALAYEQRIKKILGNKGVDLMLLGMGADGHTASLFPGAALADEKRRLIKEVWVPEKNQYRITCTLPFINKSKQLLFLVTGAGKAPVFTKIAARPSNKIPATLVQSKLPVWWFVTKEVAGLK